MIGTMDKRSFRFESIPPETSIPIAAAPLYRRIHHELRHLIISGKILPGDTVSPEKELAKQYGVSRFTIQQVFRLLVQEGLVVRRQGLGTFIRELEKTHMTPKVTLQLGGLQCAGAFQTLALERFSRRVAELTRNQVNIQFSKETFIGSASSQLRKVSIGEQDMFSASTEWIEEIEPTWGVTSLPFLFQSMGHVHRFTKSEAAESLRRRLLRRKNIRVLADNWVRPSRLILSIHPCFEVEDFKGLCLRIPDIQTYRHMWEALGAKPVAMPWNEIPNGIKKKKIHGIDAPRDIVKQENFHHYARFIINTRHIYPRACILISEKRFRLLRSDVQQALLTAAKEAGESYSENALAKWEEDKRQIMLEGARFIDTDPTPFRQKTAALYKSHPELQQQIESIISMKADTARNESGGEMEADM
jgi:TRAP-type C4-dicarboxylate transport system substrate-binding protein